MIDKKKRCNGKIYFSIWTSVWLIDNINFDKILILIKLSKNNEVLPLAMSRHVFVSETYPNMLNINLKQVTSHIVLPKIFLHVFMLII